VNKTEKIQSTLISIIDKIESQRIKKMNRLQEMSVGTQVKYREKIGLIIEVSPKQTSIIVEFADQTKKRFFMNKRKNHETLESLSLHKTLNEIV